jgi:hypothetical protein
MNRQDCRLFIRRTTAGQAKCHTEERIVGDRPALRGIVLLTRRRHCTVGKRDFFVRSLFGQACPGSEGVRRSHHGR